MKAILRQVRISPKKANLVADLVRRKSVTEALDVLKFTPKKAAGIIRKVIASAAANAEQNFKQKIDTLVVKEIIVTEGATYKRSLPISKGRVHPILKRTSHITVKVESTVPVKATAPKKEETVEQPEVKAEDIKPTDDKVKVTVKKSK